jgi:hypothetical protein
MSSASEQSTHPTHISRHTHTSSVTTIRSKLQPLPLQPRHHTHRGSSIPFRITKLHSSRDRISSHLRLRPSIALQKCFHSLFRGSHDHIAALNNPLLRPRTSSVESRLSSSLHGSVSSIDFVSPAAPMFSRPSLHSTQSESDSTSNRLSFGQIGYDFKPLSRAHIESDFTVDDARPIEEKLLEPSVERGITRTMSDVLFGLSPPTEDSVISLLHQSERIAYHSDSGNKTERDSVSQGPTIRQVHSSDALGLLAPRPFSRSYHLPVEITQHIYDYLGPKDFNSARHTCSNWMRASLDKNVLVGMLRRSGWSSGAGAVCGSIRSQGPASSCAVIENEEWLISRYLSRQCALSSRWTGNGVDSRPAIIESSQINFEELANGDSSSTSDAVVFSTSECGRFMVAARGTLVYIYEFKDGSLVPVTGVVCPRGVRSMSMAVSSSRQAVAMLLEGRMGMLCELGHNYETKHQCLAGVPKETIQQKPCSKSRRPIFPSSGGGFGEGVYLAAQSSCGVCSSFLDAQEHGIEPVSAIDVRSGVQNVDLENVDSPRTHERNLINSTWNLDMHGPSQGQSSSNGSCSCRISIVCRTSTFYRHLCSKHDPPRSISICSQRRCVAFGCSAGIELHWIDATTGQSLSR